MGFNHHLNRRGSATRHRPGHDERKCRGHLWRTTRDWRKHVDPRCSGELWIPGRLRRWLRACYRARCCRTSYHPGRIWQRRCRWTYGPPIRDHLGGARRRESSSDCRCTVHDGSGVRMCSRRVDRVSVCQATALAAAPHASADRADRSAALDWQPGLPPADSARHSAPACAAVTG
jgi:hypothetical protein